MFMENFTKSIMVILVRKAKLILVTGQLLLLMRIIPYWLMLSLHLIEFLLQIFESAHDSHDIICSLV